MTLLRAWLASCLLLPVATATAAEIGMVTLVDGGARLLRGATWYKVAVGTRVEDADIVATRDATQLQVELATGTIANRAGAGTIHFASSPPDGPRVIAVSGGWLKVAAKAPGVRVRTPAFDVATADGILVVRAQASSSDVFVETGGAKLYEPPPSAAAPRDAKRGEHWSKGGGGAFASVPRAPKAFVDAMPRNYLDPLPALAARVKAKPALVADGEVTFAEAQPWLDGRDRAAFEKRFAIRLRDPAFRKAVEPHVARYPSWDRQLNPEKYAPKPAPAK